MRREAALVIHGAVTLLMDHECWCQGATARTAAGVDLDRWDVPDRASMCLGAAISCAAHAIFDEHPIMDGPVGRTAAAIVAQLSLAPVDDPDEALEALIAFNDDPGTSHELVMIRLGVAVGGAR